MILETSFSLWLSTLRRGTLDWLAALPQRSHDSHQRSALFRSRESGAGVALFAGGPLLSEPALSGIVWSCHYYLEPD